jgi:hypothetical protein
MGILMIKLLGRATIPALSVGAALGIFVSPAMASSYIVSPGTYPLTVNGNYGGTGGGAGPEPYYSADFAHSDVENGGNGTTYNFYFTIGSGSTDYLNLSAPSTGTLEGFDVSTFTYTGVTPGPNTPVSGPTLINDSSGISLPFTAGASSVNYYVEINLYCGDTSACNAGGDDVDPSNDVGLTGSADYTIISATPLPATLPMLAGGLGFLGFLSRRRKRHAATSRPPDQNA